MGKKILVIDDEVYIRDSVIGFLEDCGFGVIEAEAGVGHEINTPVGVGVTAASFLDAITQEFSTHYESGELKRSELESYLEIRFAMTFPAHPQDGGK